MARPLIVLASTSRYRRELLERLQWPFEVHAPQVDETALPSETPRETALRLACDKAVNVAAHFSGAIVIGSDQTVDLNGVALGKPLSHEAALAQLQSLQGRTAVFYTALAVNGPALNSIQIDCVPTTVTFRNLPTAQLEAYLRADQPYDCAGAAKIESLGIALIQSVKSHDPTALIGLPLIRLTSMLASAGIDVLGRP
jgi:septum formation protein